MGCEWMTEQTQFFTRSDTHRIPRSSWLPKGLGIYHQPTEDWI